MKVFFEVFKANWKAMLIYGAILLLAGFVLGAIAGGKIVAMILG